MKIDSATVALTASSMQASTVTKSEELRVWGDNVQTQEDGSQGEYILSLSGLQGVEGSREQESTYDISDADKAKIDLIQKMLEIICGKKLQFYVPSRYVSCSGPDCGNLQGISTARQGWGVDYEFRQSKTEKQAMSFSANVRVKTADGRTMAFTLDLKAASSFTSEQSVSFKAGDALKDPLVVNYASPSASLGNQKFSFDLDNDGKQENISFLKKGSGFLVLDRNGDGIVNNGSELFGPAKGNGFLELQAYDSDGNGWIDENDPIYDKLQIWTKDENGKDVLFAIGQAGIGAIYVRGIKSAYDLKDAENAAMGRIQETGIFLRENGTAGTVQNVDLAI